MENPAEQGKRVNASVKALAQGPSPYESKNKLPTLNRHNKDQINEPYGSRTTTKLNKEGDAIFHKRPTVDSLLTNKRKSQSSFKKVGVLMN